jgi:hypothetical protein
VHCRRAKRVTDPACQISPTWVRPNTTQGNEQKEQKHTPKQIGMDMESPVLVDFAGLLGPAIWVLQAAYLIRRSRILGLCSTACMYKCHSCIATFFSPAHISRFFCEKTWQGMA